MADDIEKPSQGGPKLAKNTIAALFRQLQVRRVVFVDDSFELTNSGPEAAIGWLDEALERSPEATRALLPEVNFLVPERGWAEEFRAAWAGIGADRRARIVAQLAAILDRYIGQDIEFATSLREIFPRAFQPTELGPTAWQEQREEILAAATAKGRVLCLFDQDLSDADGFTAEGTRSGIGLLRDVVREYPEDAVICGLLSHTFGPEIEITEWRRFAEQQELDLGRFLPISKQRLREPLSFAAAVKKTTLNLYCERMKKDAIGVLQSASRDAEEDLQAIDVYDFDQMVLRSSLKEGVAEIDTLLRVYHIFHQDQVKRAFLEPARAAQFNDTVERARSLSQVGDTLRDDRPDQRWELRHREMYEGEDLVNAFYAPLQNGDLFRLTGEAQPSLILIAQPCDLMVRSNGRRGDYGDDKVVDLVPIRSVTREVLDRARPNPALRATLPYLNRGSDDVGLVEFARAHVVRLDVLDLVVLDQEGRAQIALDAWDPDPPPQFHQAWRARRNLLRGLFEARKEAIERLVPIVNGVDDPDLRASLLAAVMPAVTLGRLRLSVPCYEGGRFDFGIQRVGRLRNRWADRLLASYMRYRAREAEQHDFSA